ncbi:MAG: oligopeptide/dipeptide ABC transporter ATP-binding protein [Thermoanaerobaculia bacterium]
MSALLEVRGLTREFPIFSPFLRRKLGAVRAVDGVDLDVAAGETVALVGESGSGKSTLGRMIVRLSEPDAGEIRFRGQDLLTLAPRELRRARRHFQIVFQDPYGSLNPRLRIGPALLEPLLIHGLLGSRGAEGRREGKSRVAAMLAEVGMPAEAAERFPHEFSGGQRQRICIARSLASKPDLLVADEPVSALDLSVRAQIVNLLADLQRERGIALLFVAHDLALVEQIADRIVVLYLGRIVEEGPTSSVLGRPQHPYTAGLIAAVPRVRMSGDRRRRSVPAGEPPSPANPPSGCPFHPRCPIARELCRTERPELRPAGAAGRVACHFPGELAGD